MKLSGDSVTVWLGAMAAVWALISGIANWVESVNAFDDRISAVESQSAKNTADLQRSDKLLSRMDYNIQIIARKVGVIPLEPTKQ
jgi:hypothetical protein